MTSRRDMLLKGINKFVDYCTTTFPNTQLSQDILTLKNYSIENITIYMSKYICEPSCEQVYNSLIAKSGLPQHMLHKIDSNKLHNYITYFREVLMDNN